LGVAVLAAVAGVSAWSTASVSAPEDFEDIRFLQQISRDHLPVGPDSMRDTEVGSRVAIDPNNQRRVVAVFQQSRLGAWGARANGYATSHDGGRNWVTATLPGLTQITGGRAERASDPAVAFGPDSAVYASSTIASHTLCPSGVAVQRSDDAGLAWNDPVVVQWDVDCTTDNHETGIAIDTGASSSFLGRAYLVWDRDRTLFLSVSDDRGETWSTPTAISPDGVSAISPVIVIQPNGDVTIVYSDWFDDFIFAQTSHDGGVTFDPVVGVSSYEGVDPSDMWTGALDNRLAVAVDQSTGQLYVVWQDGRLRPNGLNDVFLTISSDGGASWSPAQKVNPDPSDSRFDHLIPAVSAARGYVHVTYVFRDLTDGLNQQVVQRYLVSADGGVTFGDELDLGQPSDLTWAARFGNDYLALLGEQLGIAATGTRVYVVWPRATRPGAIIRIYHQAMWSATIER
jgi:hypothetical protein